MYLRDEVPVRARIGRWLGVAIATALIAPVAAAADTLTVNDDAAGPGPTGATCDAPATYTKIEAAIDAATAGDTILVCAGTYTEPDGQVLIDKSLSIVGAGPGLSIIDGQGDQPTPPVLPSAGLIRTTDAVNSGMLFEGFTVRNAGQHNLGASTARMAVIPKGADPGTTLEYANLAIEGRGHNGRDYGFDADGPDNDVILRDSTITNTDYNPVLIERVNGEVTVEDNEISSEPTAPSTAVFAMTHLNDAVTNPWTFAGNEIDANGAAGMSINAGYPPAGVGPATFSEINVIDNTISDFTTVGIAIANNSPTADGLNGEIDAAEVSGNVLTPGSGTETGVRVRGLVSGVEILGNDLRGMDAGVALQPGTYGPHVPTGVSAAFNRITGNTVGLENATGGPVAAELNWWGCNEGPGAAGCDPLSETAAGSTDVDPRLELVASATPTEIATGGETSTIDVGLVDSATGAAPTGIEELPGEFSVDLSTTLGAVAPDPLALDATRAGTATLTSGDQAGTATVTADLDNAAATASVEFTQDVVPGPPVPTGKAQLGLGAKAKKRKVVAGRTAKIDASLVNSGDAAAANTRVCAQVKRKRMKVKGPLCRDLGSIAPGASVTSRFKIKIKRAAVGRRLKVGFTATADAVDPVAATTKVKVKRTK
jgi:hypothetical protein